MKYFLSLLVLFCWISSASAVNFDIPVKFFAPGSADSADCTLSGGDRLCCDTPAAGTCNDVRCESETDCDGYGYDCAVPNGDSGWRCCTDSTAADCERVNGGSWGADYACTSNADCTGSAECIGTDNPFDCCTVGGAGCNSYGTCAPAFPGGSEIKGPRWSCDPTGAPSLYAITDVPSSITSATYTVSCVVEWTTPELSKTAQFKMRAVALPGKTTTLTPSMTGGNYPSTTSTSSNHAYWRKVSSALSFCIEDGSNPGNCCSGSTCKNYRVKWQLDITNSSTASEVRLARVFCTAT